MKQTTANHLADGVREGRGTIPVYHGTQVSYSLRAITVCYQKEGGAGDPTGMIGRS